MVAFGGAFKEYERRKYIQYGHKENSLANTKHINFGAETKLVKHQIKDTNHTVQNVAV